MEALGAVEVGESGTSRRRYRLRTMGALALERVLENDSRDVCLGVGKPLALLTFLAMASARSARRDECTALLWANAEPGRARLSLRQAVFQLRSVLGGDAIRSDGDRLVLDAEITMDAVEFTLAATAQRDEAIDLYHGPFAEGVSFAGGSEFESWAEHQRLRLEASLLEVAEALIARHAAAGSGRAPSRAVEIARRTRVLLPDRQRSARLLLDTLLRAGAVAEARIEAELVIRALAAEGEDADASLTATLRRVQRVEGRPAGDDDPIHAEFVGRERELGELLRQFHLAVGGRSRHVHVAGHAGVGKSRLLQEFTVRLRALRCRVVLVSAVPSDVWLPHSVVARLAEEIGALRGALGISPASAQVLVALAPSLSSVLGGSAGATGANTALQRSVAIRELLAATAEERTLVLLVEDLHWCDGDSLAALQRLMDKLPPNVLAVTTARPPQSMQSVVTVASLSLEPLTTEQVAALVTGLGVDVASTRGMDVVRLLRDRSHGSPLLVLQTLRWAFDLGVLRSEGGGVRASSIDELHEALRPHDPIAGRLEACTEDERTLLAMMAVAGAPLSRALLSGACSSDTSALLTRLAIRGLISAHGAESWTVAHDLIADSVVASLPRGRLTLVHAALGAAFANVALAPNEMRQAAHHLLRGERVEPLVELALQHLKRERARGHRGHYLDIVREGLGEEAMARIASTLHRRVPWSQRPLVRPLAAVAVLAMATAGVWWVSQRAGDVTPVVVQLPVQTHRRGDSPEMLNLEPPLLVEYRGKDGTVSPQRLDSVLVIAGDANASRRDTTWVSLRDGRALIRQIRHDSGAPLTVELARSDGRRVRSLQLPHRRASEGRLRFHSFQMDAGVLRSNEWALVVPPGAFVHGTLRTEYDAYWNDETVVYAATPTWGDPRNGWMSLGTLSTPASERLRSDSLSFTAPRVPGVHFVLIVAGPEPSAEFLLSATNWVLESPVWGDGNDVKKWPVAKIESLMRDGRTTSIVRRKQNGVIAFSTQTWMATAFRVVVDRRATRPQPVAVGTP